MSDHEHNDVVPCLTVLDRRLSVARFPSDNTIYSLLRSWISDDPTRTILSGERIATNRTKSPPSPLLSTSVSNERRIAERSHVPKDLLLNSLCSTSQKVLLDDHLSRLKFVRRWFKRRAHLRRRRIRARLLALGVPECA